MVGYWEPHTSSIDFCEENYRYTLYVAELLNSISALVIVVVPTLALAITPRPFSRWPRFILCYLSLIVVGVGSVMFHATLRRSMQNFDEVPMILANIVYLYCIAQPKEAHVKPLFALLTGLTIAILLVYFVFEWFAVFFSIFAFQTIFLISLSYRLCFHREAGNNTTVLRRLWTLDVSVYFAAVCFWFTDNIACDQLGVGHLHILWHLFGAFGSSMFPVILIALTADAEGFTLGLSKYGVMPCLLIDAEASNPFEVPLRMSSIHNMKASEKEPCIADSDMEKEVESFLSIMLSACCAIMLQMILAARFLAVRILNRTFRGCFFRPPQDDDSSSADSSCPSVSFSGCAFRWPYTAGICQYLFEEFDLTQARIFCTSTSSFPVVCALMGVNPLNWCMVDYPKCLEHWRSRPLSCFLDSTSFLRRLWHDFLPANAHQLAEGRLVVSVTEFQNSWYGIPLSKNLQVSSFKSNADLVDCLMATISLPGIFFRGLTRRNSKVSVDGLYSERRRRPGGKTVVIGSGSWGPCDIKPSKHLPWQSVALPQHMERTKHMMNLGYEDARANHALFVSRGWRIKAAGPAEPPNVKSLATE